MITLLLIATTIQVTERDDVSVNEALEIANALAAQIAHRTGERPQVDDPTWPMRSTNGVQLRIFGALSLVRVIATYSSTSAVANLEREDHTMWSNELSRVASVLFPQTRGPSLVMKPASIAEPPSSHLLPWIAFSTGGAALAASIMLGVSNANARAQLNDGIQTAADYRTLSGRAHDHGLAANVLMTTAGVALATGIVLLLVE